MRFVNLVKIAASATLLTVGIASADSIIGSKHDMTVGNYDASQNSEGEVCIFCHTPHNAVDAGVALWNRDPSSATYTLYDAGTSWSLDAETFVLGGSSKTCLGCHDGTVAVDRVANAPGKQDWSGNSKLLTGYALVGTDLTDDHPVGFTYDTALATLDGGLVDPGILGASLPTELHLIQGQLECGTCHDVHDPVNGSFLSMANTNSDMCVACHNK